MSLWIEWSRRWINGFPSRAMELVASDNLQASVPWRIKDLKKDSGSSRPRQTEFAFDAQ